MSQGARDGRLIARRYRLVSVVGRGGMGTVWRAHDEVLDREVAVKEVIVRHDLADEERDLLHHRTLREARATARLNHPGIVTVHDVVDEDGRPWIVMELVESRSLQDVIDHDGPQPPQWVARIGRQTLGALRTAHSAGILHRDVKPANVLITGDGRAVLTDFGIAQVEGDPGLTHTGLLIGSPAYIAPERVRGERAVAASDLWALGATLYAACEGRPPYPQGGAMAVMAAVLTQDPPAPRNAGPLAPLLWGLLHRDPAQRMDQGSASRLLDAVANGTEAGVTATTTAIAPAPAAPAAAGPAWTEPGPGPVPWAPGGGDPSTVGAARPRRNVNTGLLAVAGALAVIVIGLAAVLLMRDSSPPVTSPKAGSTATRASSAATSPSGTSRASADPASPEPAANTPLPPGWRREQAPGGGTVGVPAGWRRSAERASVFWREPGSAAYLQIDTTPWTGRPYEAWRQWEREVISKQSLEAYQRVDLRHVTGTTYEAADIEFTWSGRNGIRMRGVDRRVVAGDRRYAVFVALPAAQWETSQDRVNGFLSTFAP